MKSPSQTNLSTSQIEVEKYVWPIRFGWFVAILFVTSRESATYRCGFAPYSSEENFEIDNNCPDNNDVLLLGAQKIKKTRSHCILSLHKISRKDLDVVVIEYSKIEV